MSSDSPENSRSTLAARAYATDHKLLIRRRTHEQYTIPQVDFASWVLDRITWRGDERVLDIGAGPGSYFRPLKLRAPQGCLLAGDLSLGMLRSQRRSAAARGSLMANLDAGALPFADAAFDVVLANHMLYHVSDVEAAVREIRRVLRPGGLLVAATNSIHNMLEFDTLYRRALLLLTNFELPPQERVSMVERFSLESGIILLSRHFYAVARYDLPGSLVFQEPEPVIAYLDSMRELREHTLPRGIEWEAFMDVMRQQVTRVINHTGQLVIKKLAGAVVATDSGGFIEDYVRLLNTPR